MLLNKLPDEGPEFGRDGMVSTLPIPDTGLHTKWNRTQVLLYD